MRKKLMSRLALSLAILFVLSVVSACGGQTSSPSAATSTPGSSTQPDKSTDNAATPASDKKFAGTTITVVLANHPWANAIKPLIPEFEQKTGIKVNVTSYFEDQLTQKLTVQFTSGSRTPDVFMYRPLQEGKLFFKNGWVEPLDAYVQKAPSFDFNDFFKTAVSTSTVDGKLAGIPIITEQEILYYRKDLLEKANIPVPKTITELKAAAAKLNDPKNEMYGFVARGQRAALVTQLSSFIYSEGGDFTVGSKATINTPQALKGIKDYADLLKQYGPPGVANMSWPQAMGLFTQEKAVFYTDANSIYKNAIDPEKSVIADKVGFAVFPAGDAGSQPYNVTSWGIAMNAQSEHKDAGWEFIQWATSKEIVLKTQEQGNPGARTSVWENPDGVKGFPQDLVPIIKEEAKSPKDHDRPVVINVGEARDIVGGVVLKEMLENNVDLQQLADQENVKLQQIIDKDLK